MNKFAEVKAGKVVAVTFGKSAIQHHKGSKVVQLTDGKTVPELGWNHDGAIFTAPIKPPAPVIPEPESEPIYPYRSYTYQLFLKILSDDELELLLEKKNGTGRAAAKIERFLVRLKQQGIDFNQLRARNIISAMVPGIFADTARIDQIVNNV